MTNEIKDLEGIFEFIKTNSIEEKLLGNFLYKKLQDLVNEGKIKREDITDEYGGPLGVLKKTEKDGVYYFLNIFIDEQETTGKKPKGTVSIKEYKNIHSKDIETSKEPFNEYDVFYPKGNPDYKETASLFGDGGDERLDISKRF